MNPLKSAPPPAPAPVYVFGEFRLDTVRRVLERAGQPVEMTPKSYETLLALVRGRDRVIEKAELMEMVWPDSFVEENNLSQQISALRKIFGERPEEGRFIRTIAGRGYRFMPLVTEGEGVPPVGAGFSPPALGRLKPAATGVIVAVILAVVVVLLWRQAHTTPPAAAPPRSIAILPFASFGDPTDRYLGLGLTDVLITRCSNLRGVTVRPTSAVRRYGGSQDPVAAGRELAVESVLEGTIQRIGEQVRVTVRLSKVSDGSSLWGATFDEKFTSLFAVEDSISARVARALAPRLSAAELRRITRHDTDSPEAHRLYLRGLYSSRTRTPEASQKAIDDFQQAIAIDPTYALAYAGLADAYYRESTVHLTLAEAMPKAKAAAVAALQLDDTLAEAHTSLAMVKFHYDWDFAGAEQEFRRALQSNPNAVTAHQWYSEYLTAMGRVPESVAEATRAKQIDPLSPEVDWNLGLALLFGRRTPEAVRQLQRSVDANPRFWLTRAFLAWAYAEEKDYPQAFAEFEKARALDDNADILSTQATVYAHAGKRDDAERVAHELLRRSEREYVSPFYLGAAFIGIGDREKGFAWLEKAADERSDLLVFINVAPNFDDVRSDPRFVALTRRVGLPAGGR